MVRRRWLGGLRHGGAALLVVSLFLAGAAVAGTLDDVRQRGVLRCGVSQIPGLGARDGIGGWRGFQVDFCRAVALAALGSDNALEIVPLSETARFLALQERRVDVLNASVTWTASRENRFAIAGAQIFFYDGQGFIAHRSLGVQRLADVLSPSICVVEGTTGALTLRSYIQAGDLSWRLMAFPSSDLAWSAFLGGQCDMHSNDLSMLAVQRVLRTANSDDYVLLPDMISREPIASFVRDDDHGWERLVRWTINALILAEEKGLTIASVASVTAASVTDIEVRTLLGQEGTLAESLGVHPDWGRRIIATLGHYGDIFERNLGAGSPFHLSRGINRQWRDGGLLYALPFK